MSTSENSDYECIVRENPDGEGWLAEYPDIIGAKATAPTKKEAIKIATTMLHQWLENAKEIGLYIPTPGEYKKATGTICLQLPESLYRSLVVMAYLHGLSLTEFIARLLVSGIRDSSSKKETGVEVEELVRERGFTYADAEEVLPTQEFSGVWVQPISKILHRHLLRVVESDKTTIHTLCIYVLSTQLACIPRAE